MTALRFILDEHMDRAVAAGLLRRGIEARTVHEVGRRGAADEDHLEWARENGWIVDSGDEDFLRLARTTAEHAGVAYYRHTKFTIGMLVHRLTELAEAETMESMRVQVKYL